MILTCLSILLLWGNSQLQTPYVQTAAVVKQCCPWDRH